MPQRERESAQLILSSRANWSLEFIQAIDAGIIKREDVRPATVLAMQGHKQKTINALVKNGFQIESFVERDELFFDPWPDKFEPSRPNYWRLKEGEVRFPLSFTLKAKRV